MMSNDDGSALESMVAIMVAEQVKKWTAQLQDTYTARYNDMLQERKETLAIVNRLGKYVENVDSRVNTISDQLRTLRKSGDGEEYVIDRNTVDPSTEKLSQRVDVLEIVCGYDLQTESSVAISKGCSEFILPSRRISQRLSNIEKTISQLNSDLNVLLKEGVISFSKNSARSDDFVDMSDPYSRLMGAHDLNTLLGFPNNQYDAYASDNDRRPTSKVLLLFFPPYSVFICLM
jgi:uncharacterized protein YoxC